MVATSGSPYGQPQLFIGSTVCNRSLSNAPLIENKDTDQIAVPDKRSWKNLFAYVGPGFLVSIAYEDPETLPQIFNQGHDINMSYISVTSCAALLIQSMAANLGVVTGKHLAEHCRTEYSRVPNFILWVIAEIAIVACDIPEVIGTAFALNMLFNIPIWIGVLLTGLSTMMLLALQQYGVRKLEFFIAFLVFTIAVCFMAELKPDAKEVLKGLFVPELKGNGATGLAISLLGAMVMPWVPQEACRFYMIESAFALMVALNVSVISISGAVCNSSNLSAEDQINCQDLDLNKDSFLLRVFETIICILILLESLLSKSLRIISDMCQTQNVLGKWSSKLFAIALLASGQSCTITGTYAGQYVMQGFLDLRLKSWIRNLLTRCLAIVPSLIVALIGGSAGSGKLIIIASMILSFELPFALIPLLKFTSSSTKMGTEANLIAISIVTWIIGSLIMAINIYYLLTSFIKLLLHSHLIVAKVFLGIFGVSGMAVYMAGIAYLVFHKNNKGATHLLALNNTPQGQEMGSEQGNELNQLIYSLPREDIVSMQLPQRSGPTESF